MPKFFSKKRNEVSIVKKQQNQTLVSCKICGRNFANDRVNEHEQICQRVFKKTRPVYDTVSHRLRGITDDQGFGMPNKKSKRNYPQTSQKKYAKTNEGGACGGGAAGGSGKQGHDCCGHKRTNWRNIHKEFITNIRNARMVQTHLDSGGKISDLPPVIPSENRDYIQCPHCLRRFNQTAGARHIPQCANYEHNKPKPKKN